MSGRVEYLVDEYGRPLLHLRISVTSRCNLHCFYCHREGYLSTSRELDLDDWIFLCRVFRERFGVDKVKITGGEPLLRPDIVYLVRELSKLRLRDLAMTTNGVLLESYAEDLVRAGLQRVNVGLPSLRREVYEFVTGVDALDDVLRGLRCARRAGLRPVKVNFVLLRGVNDGEVWDVIRYCMREGLQLQLIELEPLMSRNLWNQYFLDLSDLTRVLENLALYREVRYDMQRRIRYWLTPHFYVEVVKFLHNSDFCRHCTKMRVTPDGKLKPCLMSDDVVDVRSAVVRRDVEKLTELIRLANRLRRPYNVVVERSTEVCPLHH